MTKFGQHFLTDAKVLAVMAKVVKQYGSHQTILEIGPGKGVLTQELVKIADRVVAVEIDRKLSSYLKPLERQHPNLTVVYGDILRLNLADLDLVSGQYSLASNLPYDITGAVLRQFLTQQPYPSHIALLIQKEVAQRITAKPGQLSILGLSVQAFSKPRIVCSVDRTAFSPKPAVQSAIVSLEQVRANLPFDEVKEKRLFRIIKLGFAQKRKFLKKNLFNIPNTAIAEAFADLGLLDTVRAQELSLTQWLALVDKLDKFIV